MLSGLSLLVAGEAGAIVRRHVRAIALFAVAGLMLIGTLTFALVALHAWLQLRYGAVDAGLIIAAGLFIVAMLFLALGFYIRRPRRDRSALAATALVMAPAAASFAARRINFAAIGIAGVIAAGAYIGRKLAKS